MLLATALFSMMASNAQSQSKWSIEANYGLTGNFFVRDYDEVTGPANSTNFYTKNFLGSIGGVELYYRLNNSSRLAIGYSRSNNKGRKNGHTVINGVDVWLQDFNLSHINNFFQVLYERQFSKRNTNWKYHAGLVIINSSQQEISFENFANQVLIEERNFKNSKLQEGGVFTGLQFTKSIEKRFELGIRTRIYYLLSTGTIEALTLTPTIAYKF